MKIGNIELGDKPLFLAPMEDVTDPSFRYMCKRFGADVVTTEFISSDGLIRDAWKSRAKLNIDEAERPVGIQIYGHLIEPMVEAARIAETARPDFIDINFGCPVKKIAGRGAGSGMMRDVPLMVEMTRQIVEAVETPVTVKTRLGCCQQRLDYLGHGLTYKSGVNLLSVRQHLGLEGCFGHIGAEYGLVSHVLQLDGITFGQNAKKAYIGTADAEYGGKCHAAVVVAAHKRGVTGILVQQGEACSFFVKAVVICLHIQYTAADFVCQLVCKPGYKLLLRIMRQGRDAPFVPVFLVYIGECGRRDKQHLALRIAFFESVAQLHIGSYNAFCIAIRPKYLASGCLQQEQVGIIGVA